MFLSSPNVLEDLTILDQQSGYSSSVKANIPSRTTPETFTQTSRTLLSSNFIAVGDYAPQVPVVFSSVILNPLVPNLVVPVLSALPSLVVPSLVVPGPVVSVLLSPVIPSPVVPEVLPLSSVLPVMATAILCLWATHTSAAPSEAAASTFAPSVCLVVAMEAISEPFVCPVMTKKAVSEPSACQLTVKKAISEPSTCPIMATEAISELCLPFGDKRRP